MKKTLIIASSLALVASLAACKKEAEAPQPAESAASNTASMSEMPMATEMKHGKGVGTVTAIDAAILVRGAPLELMKARQRRFYFDQGGNLVKHFGIRAVPATVEQQGRVLVITEAPIKPQERSPS